MSYTLAPITLTENVTSYITLPGGLGSVSWIKIVNASPYLCLISNLLGGGTDYMQPGEANVWQVPGLSTAIQITPQQFGISPVIIPSSVAVVTWYLEGEQPQGNYPVNFSALSYVGNNVQVNSATNTIEQDLLTPFVLSGLLPSKDGSVANQVNVTTGIALIRQSDSSLLRQALVNATFLTTVHSTTYFLDLNPDGSWSWGTSHSTQSNYLPIAQVTTDGSGNVSTVSNVEQINTTLLSGMTGILYAPNILSIPNSLHFTDATHPDDFSEMNQSAAFFNVVLTTTTDAPTVLFVFETTASTFEPFAIGTPGFQPVKSWIDNNGVLHAAAPVTLAAGNQETGQGGFALYAPDTTNDYGNLVNFKTTMTNTPTSMTFTQTIAPVNVKTIGASAITKYGFYLFGVANAIGRMAWQGTYTTVGNCLLGFDGQAQTFDHHCDGCGLVRRGVGLSEVSVTPGATPPEHALHYTCPTCGTSEHYNGGLSAADETDSSPQGSGEYATTRGAQATLIRALMQALNIEVAS